TSNTLVIEDISLDQTGRYQVFAKNFKGKGRKLANIKVSERANQVLIVVGSEPVAAKDVTSPADTIVGTSTNSPGAEGVANAIDNNSSTKYLNTDKVNTGMTITTGGGVVTAIALTSANDAPDRDPTGFVLSGSNDGGATFTEIASGGVPAFGARFERQTVSIANSTVYTTYELIFPTTAGPSGCCMQIAEVELLDYRPSAIAATDLALKALLESQGFAVELAGPNYDPIDVDSRHYSFVVISSSLQDDSWAAKYAGTTAPVINLDSSVQDALGFIGARNDLSGTISSATQVQIVDASHPLAGGLSAGAQTVVSSAAALGWGTPNAAAAVVATAGSASHQAAVYGYESGSSMAGGIDAAGRRVNLPFQTPDLGSLTAEGGDLLVAAVDWVTGFSIIDTGRDLSATVGDSILLQGRTSGENITYQWYKNGAAIAGATSASLDLGAVQAGNSGTYKIVATDAAAPWKYRFKEISYEVSVSARGDEVVLVTGADELTASDLAVKGILASKGYGVFASTAANTSSAALDGRLLVVVSPSVATSGGTVYENTATSGAYFPSIKEFGDEVTLGLNNRLLDSLTFEYFGDFTADGDEKVVVRIYANDGAGNAVMAQPGTVLYESDPFAIAPGFNSVNVNDLLIEVPDTITWTVQFSGVANTDGDRAGLIFHNPATIGSSFDDFWINSGDVIYNSTHGVYEAYYNTGTEFGDEIDLAGSSRLLNAIEFEAYTELTSSPAPRDAVEGVEAVAAVAAVAAV
ncbi:MAG: immunoglobulin domain-containing protein, partial [Rubripirellula sp.]|nr:immunoglobulin domain-containing protein [Rubripirellula sp.]